MQEFLDNGTVRLTSLVNFHFQRELFSTRCFDLCISSVYFRTLVN